MLEKEIHERTADLVTEWTGKELDAGPGDVACERGFIINWVEATENANPIYWDETVADEITGGWIAPPTMLSVWMRPLMFKPDSDGPAIRPLDQADRGRHRPGAHQPARDRPPLDDRRHLHEPARRGRGRRVVPHVLLRARCEVNVGDALPTLELPITARTVVQGAASTRDWQPQHHDYAWATGRAGTKDIFLNTPNQAGWIERYLTDHFGPKARLGRLKFRMRKPVFPGDTLAFNGTISAADDGWVEVDLRLTVGEDTATECTARVAVPRADDENPWDRRGDDWRP